tara:strand:+ start:329 stop:913 length:585 start_codon:yes stop_codon:yes gene_type:complete
MSSDKQDQLFIITAPSGAGKTSLIKNVLSYAQSNGHKVHLTLSHTTRIPREGEIDGVDYCFIDENTFKENIQKEVYVEHAKVHGNLYGTPKDSIDAFLADDFIVLMEIDWQGALNILKAYPKAESVFISPPSIQDLKQRLLDRGLDSEDVINQRVSGAEKEISQKTNFKYEIINFSLDTATKKLINIIFRENHG